MNKISVLGIDLAKNVFQVHGVDEKGKTVLQKRLSRNKLAEFICNISPCLIGMEACGGAHYWARKFKGFGHQVKLMSPQYVKPYVKTNKNDMNDAEAICEAVTRPSVRFVPVKTVEQQDIQAVHRIRSRLISQRTGLVNQVRGLLSEYGIVIAQGISRFKSFLLSFLDSECDKLSPMAKSLFWDLQEQLKYLEEQINIYDEKVKKLCKESEICQRLLQVEGVGPLTASALIAAVGDGKIFQKGRQLSAFLGLVPRQSSSGGRNVLLGISKRGNVYLRTLMIHGARAVVRRASSKATSLGQWLRDLVQRRGYNKACVALANKNARILWAILTKQSTYQREA